MSRLANLCESALIDHPNLDLRSRQVLSHIAACKTPAMGYNISRCPSIEHDFQDIHYNSCRDRHCPLCQGPKRRAWVEKNTAELLPVPYFHVVFTIPTELHAIFRYAPRASFNGLFRSAHASLLQAAASPDNGAFIPGGISVLHTWNQKLTFHPHIHCIVPAGGISVDGTIWVHRNGEFLLPTRVLACLFRGNLLAYLETAMLKGELGSIDRYNAKHQLCLAAAKDFVVYCKPPFGGPRQVLKYLGRYTHRVGISEERLVAGGDGSATVSFIYLDRAHGHVKRTLTLSNQDFVDRFRLHILPNGLRKIRYFGYMGNRHRGENLNRVRDLILQAPGKPRQTAPETPALSDSVCSTSETKTTPQTCPICHRKLILDTSNQIGRAWAPPPLAERLRRLRKPAVAQAGPAPT